MNAIPLDLAGYQHIVTGVVEEGDILVVGPNRVKCRPTISIGSLIPSPDLPDTDVYRKMACPKAGDHDKDWRRVHDEQKLQSMAWVGERPKAKTDDSEKPPLALLPWKALRKVSRVQAYGHKKYGDFFNYKKGMEVSRQLNCAIRHIADYLDGIDLDKESGESHLAHAATRLLFALENIEDGTATDDRYKKP